MPKSGGVKEASRDAIGSLVVIMPASFALPDNVQVYTDAPVVAERLQARERSKSFAEHFQTS